MSDPRRGRGSGVGISLLGPMRLTGPDGSVAVAGRLAQCLLGSLATAPGVVVPADRLVDVLWGDQPPRNAANALQARVSQLRRVLTEAGGDPAVLGRDGVGYALAVPPGSVDACRFEALVREGTAASTPAGREAALAEALGVWAGEPFVGLEDVPALHQTAERLRELRVLAIESLLGARLDLGAGADLVPELEALVAAHPYRERSWGHLMVALHRAGRQADALAAYQRLRRVLADELGLDPGPELQELERRILLGDLEPPRAEVRTAPADGAGAATVRRPRTALLGRDRELGELRDLLAGAAVVTVTGPGGVGKTRLAQELASGWDGAVVFAQLAPVDAAGVESSVVAAAGAAGWAASASASAPVPDLAQALEGRRALVVLDNCEHVLDAACTLVDDLLLAPDLCVLATSREPLGVVGEVVVPLPPLGDVAVDLFVERAAAAGRRPDDAERAVVAELCRRLDGLPLAVELAAARSRSYRPGELLERIDARLDLLRADRRTGGPLHHRSIEAAIDWSLDLLDEDDRGVLAQLGVFSGSFGLAMAEQVVVPDGGGAVVADVIDRLVRRSLVVAEDAETGTRFRLLELIREAALRRLGDEEVAARRRHLDAYLELAHRANHQLRGPDLVRWLTVLDVEGPNLNAAIDHASEVAPTDAVALTSALCWYWFVGNRQVELLRRAHAALEIPDGDPLHRGWIAILAAFWSNATDGLRLAEQGRALLEGRDREKEAYAAMCIGHARMMGGDQAGAAAAMEAAIAGCRSCGAAWGEAVATALYAQTWFWRGEVGRAQAVVEQAVDQLRAVADPWALSFGLTNLSHMLVAHGEYGRAGELFEEVRLIAEHERLASVRMYALIGLSNLALLEQRPGDALALADEVVDLSERAGAVNVAADAHSIRGRALRSLGFLEEAREAFEASLVTYEHLFAPGAVLAEGHLGHVALAAGDLDRSRRHFGRAFEHAMGFSDVRAHAFAVEGLAGWSAAAGRPADAAALLGHASRLRDDVGVPLPLAERQDVDAALAAVEAAGVGADLAVGAEADDTVDLVRRRLGDVGIPAGDVGRAASMADPAELTVGFVDLAGFTALTEQRGDHQAVELVSRFEVIVRSALGPTDRVVKAIGDAVMLAFATPSTAVDALERLVSALAAEGGPFVARVGVHHGPVVRRGDDLFGRTVNVASRVVALAAPHEVLATEVVAAAAKDLGVPVEARGPVQLRNVSDPVELYALAWAR